ncbi:aminotransferase class V-fold PLP-dependent enzyme [Vibrio gallicus]|uniref:aminotransferase class V-fold PLP-dependent enzyme n=1 Tax=Vibrio gallicus TaxID=190897 RepID=UPI0021C28619|nr:aminotransferase class V-fold PLP-dependent enzyme [Vibrio gallicus]
MSKDTSKFNRRDFLKGGAGVAVAGISSGLFSTQASAHNLEHTISKLSRHSADNDFWMRVKNQFSLNRDSVYMNVGSTGSMPTDVIKAYDKNNKIVAENPWDMDDKFGSWPYMNGMVADIAAGFGANEDELVLSRNTTDGMATILNGLDFKQGDVIITTHHEHIGATSSLHVVKERFGVEVYEVEIPVYTGEKDLTQSDYIRAFRKAIRQFGDRVRLVAFSHIPYKTGTALPAKEICRLARRHRIPTLIDGAHGIGMLDLDFHDLDCDFYAGSGHKWQCGAGATGILYIKDNATRLEEFWPDDRKPLYFINSSLAASADTLGARLAAQYVGNDNYPAKQALTDSCKMWDSIGRARIQERVLDLSSLCKEQLARKIPQGTLFTSPRRELSSGLTTFNPFSNWSDEDRLNEFRDRLREDYGYIIRTTEFLMHKDSTEKTYVLRISTHLFHDENDVKGLVKAMAHLTRHMA